MCKHPTCEGECRRPKKEKKRYVIPKVSKKRAIVNRLYDVKARQYRKENPYCKIKSPVCTKITEGVHHMKGKATHQLLMDERYWEPACNACNSYVEAFSTWAYENGHKISKY